MNVPHTKLDTDVCARGPRRQRPATAAALPPVEPRKYAVFVAHGMGQQIPFETLDAVVEQLRERDRNERGPGSPLPTAEVGTLEIGEQRLQRVELKIRAPNGEREVHLYEGYWAPLTEGQVNLRDVLRFLLGAGWDGIQHGWGAFRRWIFGEYWTFETPRVNYLHIAAAILIVLALVVLNTAIVAVAAARSPLGVPRDWLTGSLQHDLESVFDVVLVSLLLLGGILAVARDMRNHGVGSAKRRRLAAFTAYVVFWIPVAALLLGSLAIPYLFHRDRPILVVQPTPFDRFDSGFESGLFVAAALGAIYLLARMLVKFIRPSQPYPLPGARPPAQAAGLYSLSLLVVLGAVLLSVGWARPCPLFGFGPVALRQALRGLQSALVWALLAFASGVVRTLLIQYAGDVAAYVTPHKLDRFYELRTKIKETVYQQARAVFAARDPAGAFVYDRLAIVGHSLGSAVVYDVLNRLIEEDELAGTQVPPANPAQAPPQPLDVLDRTKLLLTFGSPLDKFAFFFTLQGKETTDVREALAAEVQPLIRDLGFRTFPWINIHSPWDVISGPLTLYDLPNRTYPQHVIDEVDEEATTFFAAHTEYWKHPPAIKGAPLVVDRLYDHLIR